MDFSGCQLEENGGSPERGCPSSHYLKKYFPEGVRSCGGTFLNRRNTLNTVVFSDLPGNGVEGVNFCVEVYREKGFIGETKGRQRDLRCSPVDLAESRLV